MLKKQIVCRFEVGIFNFYYEEQIKTYPYFLKSIYGHSWRHPSSSDVATVRTHFFGPIEKGDFIKGSPLPQGMYYCLKKTFVDSTVSGVNLIFFFFFSQSFSATLKKIIKVLHFGRFFFFSSNFVSAVILAVLRPACRFFSRWLSLILLEASAKRLDFGEKSIIWPPF